ncbi:unnamed protein product [Prunus brigantina]
MLGSLDCMHWEWKNCPTAHHRAYVGHHGRPTIILEAVLEGHAQMFNLLSMVPNTTKDIILLTGYTPNGQILFKQFLNPRVRRKNLFQGNKRHSTRTWNEHLVSFKHDLPSLGALLAFGIKKILSKSRMRASFCII